MTDELAIMYIAVIVAITVMLVAATPLANFIERNPTIVMLALGFLLMIGTTLIADGFGFHVPKGYIYAAMAFSALVEGLTCWRVAASLPSRPTRPRARSAQTRAPRRAGRAEPDGSARLALICSPARFSDAVALPSCARASRPGR